MTQENVQQSASNDDQYDVASHLHYTKWIIKGVLSEIEELDEYIQTKTKDLVQKFQNIAEQTIKQDETSKSIDEKNQKTIKLSGREFTYSEATVELKRLTDALVSDGAMTYERTLLRKKIEEMLRALFGYAETSQDFSKQTKEAVGGIKKSVIDIIVAFQFQDFVTQRIEHLGIALNTLDSETDALINHVAPNSTKETAITPQMVEDLIGKFSLTKVQQKYMSHLEGSVDLPTIENVQDDDDDGIELF